MPPLLLRQYSKSYGVVPSRHIVLAPSIRGLRPRLLSLRSVVPSRHLTHNFTLALHKRWFYMNYCLPTNFREIRGQIIIRRQNHSQTKSFADKINRGQKSLLAISLGFVRYDIIHKPFGQDDIIHIYGSFEQRSDVPVLKAGNTATYAGD